MDKLDLNAFYKATIHTIDNCCLGKGRLRMFLEKHASGYTYYRRDHRHRYKHKSESASKTNHNDLKDDDIKSHYD
jgi:hypothetical protein